jgi:hypothetical protein
VPPGPASRASFASSCRKKDGQIAHGTILTRSRNPKNAHEFRNSPCTGNGEVIATASAPAKTMARIGVRTKAPWRGKRTGGRVDTDDLGCNRRRVHP